MDTGVNKLNLQWIAKEMKPGVWYNIKDEDQLRQFMQLIDKRFGWNKFTLSLSEDFKRIRKTEL